MTRKMIAVILAVVIAIGTWTTISLAEEDQMTGVTVQEEDSAGSKEEPVTQEETKATEETEATADPESMNTPEWEATPTPEVTQIPIIYISTPEPTATPTPTEVPTATPKMDAATKAGYSVLGRCVTVGADLTQAQRFAVYDDFGIDPGSVEELKVTNAEEKQVLNGIISDKKIGSVALSCCYICTLQRGSGLIIDVYNINYCTKEMYRNALKTAGVEDAYVVISAPFPVSGTGALTGIYKAYEDMTGTTLSTLAKTLGVEELALTGELSEYIGSTEAARIIAELKNVLDETHNMTDSEVREEIKKVAKAYSVSLSSGQVEQVLNLCRKLEGLDPSQLQTELTKIAKTAETASTIKEKVTETATRVYEDVKTFFDKVGDFFTGLFNGSWRS